MWSEQAGAGLLERGATYVKESKRLAKKQVRRLLQSNVVQLKLIFMHYAKEAQRSRPGAKKNTMSLPVRS